MSFHDLTATTLEGASRRLSEYSSRVLVVVNTASECGFTPQYAGLERLYESYKDKGVVEFLTAKHGEPLWNFHKYVVGKDGQVRAAFASAVTPDSRELKNAIEVALRNEVY